MDRPDNVSGAPALTIADRIRASATAGSGPDRAASATEQKVDPGRLLAPLVGALAQERLSALSTCRLRDRSACSERQAARPLEHTVKAEDLHV